MFIEIDLKNVDKVSLYRPWLPFPFTFKGPLDSMYLRYNMSTRNITKYLVDERPTIGNVPYTRRGVWDAP